MILTRTISNPLLKVKYARDAVDLKAFSMRSLFHMQAKMGKVNFQSALT